MFRKLLLVILWTLFSGGYALPGVADDSQMALKHIRTAYPNLDHTLFFTASHPVAKFGDYRLIIVSSTQFLPAPHWVVAIHSKADEILQLLPDQPSSWNIVSKTTAIPLNSKEDLSRFPITYLKIMAPAEQVKWRFVNKDYETVSETSRKLLESGWQVRKKAAGYTIKFFSQSISGRLRLWQMAASSTGEISSIKTRHLD